MKRIICNPSLVKETGATTGEARVVIKDIVDHYLGFTAYHVHNVTLETVQIPYFGKFEARKKLISQREYAKGLPKKQRRRP